METDDETRRPDSEHVASRRRRSDKPTRRHPRSNEEEIEERWRRSATGCSGGGRRRWWVWRTDRSRRRSGSVPRRRPSPPLTSCRRPSKIWNARCERADGVHRSAPSPGSRSYPSTDLVSIEGPSPSFVLLWTIAKRRRYPWTSSAVRHRRFPSVLLKHNNLKRAHIFNKISRKAGRKLIIKSYESAWFLNSYCLAT